MSERRPRLKMEPFKLALSPSDKLGCSFASQDSNTTEKAQIFLTALDHFATQHGYKLEGYGRLDMFVAIHAANEEEPLRDDAQNTEFPYRAVLPLYSDDQGQYYRLERIVVDDGADTALKPDAGCVDESFDDLFKERAALRGERSLLIAEVEKYKKEAIEALNWVCCVAERTESYHIEWDLAEERLEEAERSEAQLPSGTNASSPGAARPLPQPGERYWHFEGGEYVVIAVATQSGEFLSSMAESTTFSGPIKSASWCAHNPDTQQEICFDWRKDLPPRITCESKEIQEPYIFYEGEESVWASSLKNFLGVISSDEGTNFYRFERIVDDINDVEVGSVQDLFKERDALRGERSRLMDEVEKYRKKAENAWDYVADLDSDHLSDKKKLKEELTQAKAQLAQALIEQSDIIDVPGEHDSLEEFIENLEFTYPMVRLNQVIDSTLLTLSKAYARAGYPEGASIGDFLTWLEDFSKDVPDILSAKLNPVSAIAQEVPRARIWTNSPSELNQP